MFQTTNQMMCLESLLGPMDRNVSNFFTLGLGLGHKIRACCFAASFQLHSGAIS